MNPNFMCFWHGYEPVREGDFWVCGECWHVWRTAEDFERDLVKVANDLSGQLPPDGVRACPLCAHDW